MPLVESTRGTLDEIIANTEKKQEVEPYGPTTTQEQVGGTLGE
jgi:hypothetical protein